MNAKFNHQETDMMKVLGMTEERANEIGKTAHQEMVDKFPQGTKAKYLERLIVQCKTIEEVIATTIIWKKNTDAMESIVSAKRIQEKMDRDIIMPNKGIIKPFN